MTFRDTVNEIFYCDINTVAVGRNIVEIFELLTT